MFEKFISLAGRKFTFLQQMNIFARPGNSMETAQFPLYDNQEMLSLAHQPCLILCLLSLSLLSFETSYSFFPSLHPD